MYNSTLNHKNKNKNMEGYAEKYIFYSLCSPGQIITVLILGFERKKLFLDGEQELVPPFTAT